MNANPYSVYPRTAPAKKASKAPLVVLVVVLVLAAVCTGVFLLVRNDPAMVVTRALSATVKAAGSSEPAAILSDAAEAGSIELSGSAGDLTEALLGIRVNAGLRVKTVFNTKKANEALLEGALTVNGADMADFAAYSDGKSVSVRSEAILGAQTLGVDFAKVREEFDASVFGPNGAYSLGIDGDELADLLEGIAESAGDRKDGKKALEKALAEIGVLLRKKASFSKENGELASSSGAIATKNVTLVIGGEELYDFLTGAAEIVRNNGELMDSLDGVFSGLGRVFNLPENARDFMDEAIDSIGQSREEIEKTTFSVLFQISKKTGQIAGVGLTGETEGGGRIDVNFYCLPDWSSPLEMSLYGKIGEDSFSASWNVGGAPDYKIISFQYSLSEVTILEGRIGHDTKDGAFNAEVTAAGTNFSLSGRFEKSGKAIKLILDSADIGETHLALGGITVTVRRSDDLHSLGEYRDALTLSGEEVDKIVGDVREFIVEFANEAIGILGGFLIGGLLG